MVDTLGLSFSVPEDYAPARTPDAYFSGAAIKARMAQMCPGLSDQALENFAAFGESPDERAAANADFDTPRLAIEVSEPKGLLKRFFRKNNI